MKLKFEEAISIPESQRISVADSIDFRSIGTCLFCPLVDPFFSFASFLYFDFSHF